MSETAYPQLGQLLSAQTRHFADPKELEEFGTEMNNAEFTDALLGLLEDVPGYETAKQSSISNLTNHLWSKSLA